VRRGPGFEELEIGRHPDLFFAVHRIDLTGAADEDTSGRFHVLALVEGDDLRIEAAGAEHRLSFGETIVVPAAVGRYELRASAASKVVKAFVV
jgi:mannose-6-phosphate isomerase class I